MLRVHREARRLGELLQERAQRGDAQAELLVVLARDVERLALTLRAAALGVGLVRRGGRRRQRRPGSASASASGSDSGSGTGSG